jgi:beta-N-acetylhexosaminidase
LRALCATPPILTIDQEGGRVSRLKEVGEMPPYADDLRRAGRVEWITEHGRLTARLLRLQGFNLNLAPVADILLDPARENSLMARCYGTSAGEVTRNAGAFLHAMQEGGVAGTIKHFPGYSMCGKDPHGGLPVVDRTRDELERDELQVFRALAPHAACVMVGHAVYPHLDPVPRPSSLSPVIGVNLLREDVGFGGLVMTDDLEMGAIAQEHGPAVVTRMAVAAGNDLLLWCHQREVVEIAARTLARMPRAALAGALGRMAAFKARLQPALDWDARECASVNAEIRELRCAVEAALA